MNAGQSHSYMNSDQYDQFQPSEHSSQEPGFVSKLTPQLTKGRSQIPRQRSIRRKQESGEYIKSMRKLPTTMKRTYHYDQPESRTRKVWSRFACCVTILVPTCCMRQCGLKTQAEQVAWREKISLVVIICFIALIVGFLTFGFQQVVCGISPSRVDFNKMSGALVTVRGVGYDLGSFVHPGNAGLPQQGIDTRKLFPLSSNERDLSFMFQDPQKCSVLFGPDAVKSLIFPCTLAASPPNTATEISGVREACHNSVALSQLLSLKTTTVFIGWPDVLKSSDYVIYNNLVLDLSLFSKLNVSGTTVDLNNLNGFDFNNFKSTFAGTDATFYLNKNENFKQIGQCFQSMLTIAQVDVESPGCIIANIVLITSLVVIISVVIIRFILAILFAWFLSKDIGTQLTPNQKQSYLLKKQQQEEYWHKFQNRHQPQSLLFGQYSQFGNNRQSVQSLSNSNSQSPLVQPDVEPIPDGAEAMHAILLVTAYSENEIGLRATLDSLASTEYSNTHKLILVVCDGIIKGSGNTKSTPEIVVDLMQLEPAFPSDPIAYSYVSIANGRKRHNMAKIFAGSYKGTPMVTIIKTGTPEEATANKPGNRGKRDSQIILMNFLQKVTFDDRMTPLEYDLFQKVQYLTGVNPDVFECTLMVDADTVIAKNSLSILVSSLVKDDAIIGLCGETRINNKTESWVTAIQVFEYYLAHHNAKAFESVFGGVTCLPGCFCMYRIKAPKGDGFFVPILGNPEIVEQYSENVVDTLHKKNLYLLGEDRFLTTIMLKTFPRRKMMFIPQAHCKTEVPSSFRVLLSQRRRWINSTVHNLLELVMVSDLCGTFCISMQFVIFMELVGTVVLPAAILFTIWLIVSSIINVAEWIPLALLVGILGLPALLIGLTSFRYHYVIWMLIYLLSLPVWNFILPIYAFWHFDDFTWGETRVITQTGLVDDDMGLFDSSKIVMKRYAEWKQLQKRGVVLRDQLVSAGVVNTDGTSGRQVINDNNTNSYFGGGYGTEGMTSVITVPREKQEEVQYHNSMYYPEEGVPETDEHSPIELHYK